MSDLWVTALSRNEDLPNGSYVLLYNAESGELINSVFTSDKTSEMGIGGGLTGGAVDPVTGYPYWTEFFHGHIMRMPPDFSSPPEIFIEDTGYSNTRAMRPESLVIRGDRFLIGHADWAWEFPVLAEWNRNAEFVAEYNPEPEEAAIDWIDLASDDRTIFYTSEGTRIMRYDLVTKSQLSDFAIVPNETLYALVLRKADNHVFVVGYQRIYHFDSEGQLVTTFQPRSDSVPVVGNGEDFSFFAGCLSIDEQTLYVGDNLAPSEVYDRGRRIWAINTVTGEGQDVPFIILPSYASEPGGLFTGQAVGGWTVGRIGM